jgi:hypothetical protein
MDALGLVCQVLLLGLFVDLLLLSAPALGSWIAASGPSRSLHRHTGSSAWAGMKCTTFGPLGYAASNQTHAYRHSELLALGLVEAPHIL